MAVIKQAIIESRNALTAEENFSIEDAVRPKAFMTSIPFTYSTIVPAIVFAVFCVFLEHSHHIFSSHHHPINEKTKNQGSERGQGKLPAYGKHINDDNCKAKDMGSQLREHMCQRVFQMFDFVHKNFFILAGIALCCFSH